MDELDKGRRLSEEILAEADRKAARILGKAEREAGAILAEAKSQAAGYREKMLAEARVRAENAKQRILRGTELEIRKDSLVRYRDYCDTLIPEAAELARRQGFEMHPDWLADSLARGLAVMGEDAGSITFSQELDDVQVKALVARLRFSGMIRRDPGLAPVEAVIASGDGDLRYEILVEELAIEHDREMRQAALEIHKGEEDD